MHSSDQSARGASVTGRFDPEVRPQVKVSGQEKGDAMKLHCQVYGFYPRPVDVKWMNGKDEVHSYETTRVLPNPDGTYQIRVSTEVTPKDGDSYSCYVDHSSLEEPLLDPTVVDSRTCWGKEFQRMGDIREKSWRRLDEERISVEERRRSWEDRRST
ncbi:unnamed protein product [Ranitomeya imitator]|uniref:Ig-like domain-containing protein n=1 Tax=Ranitomeya imitator TaxID=111125 RepID=A0ABN9LUQ9_9NEOB|nr:unnamed protein product [Ranitomeya imitator]